MISDELIDDICNQDNLELVGVVYIFNYRNIDTSKKTLSAIKRLSTVATSDKLNTVNFQDQCCSIR